MADSIAGKRVKTNKAAGKAFEYRVRDVLIEYGFEAQRIVLSGMMAGDKGDVKADMPPLKFLIECKKSRSDAITVTGPWLHKIIEEAKAKDRIPLLVHGTLSARPWATLPLPLLCDLIKKASQTGHKCPKCNQKMEMATVT